MRQSHALSGFGVLIGAAGYVNAPTPAYAGEKNLELSSPSGDRVESLGRPQYRGSDIVAFFEDGRVVVKDFIGAGTSSRA